MRNPTPSISFALLLISSILAGAVAQRRIARPQPALNDLVAAERAFASTAVQKGIRDSFLAFFADDGINFQPHPTKAKEALQKRPAPTGPPAFTLNWEPIYADVSQAGDLGYTTGPFTLSDNSAQAKPARHGYYFSVWKKQPDGMWKVALDCGIYTGGQSAPASVRFRAALPSTYKQRGRASKEHALKLLLETDSSFTGLADKDGAMRAYNRFLGEDARLHRDGIQPITDRRTILDFISRYKMTWHPLQSDVARSDDLGYTYGSYDLQSVKGADSREKGYYVRVWKREADGEWKVVLDVTSPIPEGQ